MKRPVKLFGKILKGIVKGIKDTALPNVKESIKMKEPELPNEKKKVEIDFVRLITAVTIWIILLLVFFGKVKFEDVVELISNLVRHV